MSLLTDPRSSAARSSTHEQAVLDVIEREELADNASRVGSHLLAGLRKLQEQCDVIGDVRGVGLFLGIEFVWPPDDGEKRPATAHAKFVKDRCKEKGFLLSTDGPFDNVIKIKPPMCFSIDDADGLVAALTAVLVTEMTNDVKARIVTEEERRRVLLS